MTQKDHAGVRVEAHGGLVALCDPNVTMYPSADGGRFRAMWFTARGGEDNKCGDCVSIVRGLAAMLEEDA